MQVSFEQMEGKQTEGGGRGSNDRCCYACGEVGHPARTCPNKEKVLAPWKEKKAAVNKGTEKKEKEKEERRRRSRGGCKKGGYGGGGGRKQQSLRLGQTSGGENDNAKVLKVQELSDSTRDDDDDSHDTGLGNGDGSD